MSRVTIYRWSTVSVVWLATTLFAIVEQDPDTPTSIEGISWLLWPVTYYNYLVSY
jgi:hypothetical protein